MQLKHDYLSPLFPHLTIPMLKNPAQFSPCVKSFREMSIGGVRTIYGHSSEDAKPDKIRDNIFLTGVPNQLRVIRPYKREILREFRFDDR